MKSGLITCAIYDIGISYWLCHHNSNGECSKNGYWSSPRNIE